MRKALSAYIYDVSAFLFGLLHLIPFSYCHSCRYPSIFMMVSFSPYLALSVLICFHNTSLAMPAPMENHSHRRQRSYAQDDSAFHLPSVRVGSRDRNEGRLAQSVRAGPVATYPEPLTNYNAPIVHNRNSFMEEIHGQHGQGRESSQYGLLNESGGQYQGYPVRGQAYQSSPGQALPSFSSYGSSSASQISDGIRDMSLYSYPDADIHGFRDLNLGVHPNVSHQERHVHDGRFDNVRRRRGDRSHGEREAEPSGEARVSEPSRLERERSDRQSRQRVQDSEEEEEYINLPNEPDASPCNITDEEMNAILYIVRPKRYIFAETAKHVLLDLLTDSLKAKLFSGDPRQVDKALARLFPLDQYQRPEQVVHYQDMPHYAQRYRDGQDGTTSYHDEISARLPPYYHTLVPKMMQITGQSKKDVEHLFVERNLRPQLARMLLEIDDDDFVRQYYEEPDITEAGFTYGKEMHRRKKQAAQAARGGRAAF
jgi:hypothetical protein